ncbi:hypothetical protein FGRMN_5178 [Fusarium graminum]|nr:hypothetical protein FGRMN_5178 [Fusarium graminum]
MPSGNKTHLGKIKKYRDLESQIQTHVASGAYNYTLLKLTADLLSLNPEHYTIWNVRRRCLTSSVLTQQLVQQEPHLQNEDVQDANHQSDIYILKSELNFTVPLLMGFPKCYWIWNLRQWILSQAILRLTVPAARDIWETELQLTSKMLFQDQRNFHARGYRRFVVAKLESVELRGQSMVEDEFEYTTKMTRRNLSNFSAWHNISQIIPRLLLERNADNEARATFLDEELSFVTRGLDVGPVDQSLCHIKWIYEALLEYTLILERLEQCGGGESGVNDLQTWLPKLWSLDSMRKGRWEDVEAQIVLPQNS